VSATLGTPLKLGRRCAPPAGDGGKLGDVAPDDTAETTRGTIDPTSGSAAGGGSSSVPEGLYPKDLTPVCTPELGDVSRLKGEFDERGAKVIGLSLDPIDSHERWVGEIADATGQALNFPLIADPDRKVSNL
jgi:alkyl hydroperoxide reductase subunit AhpC